MDAIGLDLELCIDRKNTGKKEVQVMAKGDTYASPRSPFAFDFPSRKESSGLDICSLLTSDLIIGVMEPVQISQFPGIDTMDLRLRAIPGPASWTTTIRPSLSILSMLASDLSDTKC